MIKINHTCQSPNSPLKDVLRCGFEAKTKNAIIECQTRLSKALSETLGYLDKTFTQLKERLPANLSVSQLDMSQIEQSLEAAIQKFSSSENYPENLGRINLTEVISQPRNLVSKVLTPLVGQVLEPLLENTLAISSNRKDESLDDLKFQFAAKEGLICSSLKDVNALVNDSVEILEKNTGSLKTGPLSIASLAIESLGFVAFGVSVVALGLLGYGCVKGCVKACGSIGQAPDKNGSTYKEIPLDDAYQPTTTPIPPEQV